MADKLAIYNEAIRELKGYPLADLVTANTELQELDGAWDQAVRYVLDLTDWNFARKRATLTGATDTNYPPYSLLYTKPANYVRKVWLKLAAPDEFQADHAEIAAGFYGYETTLLIEYISDHADNLDPTNWPPQFARVMALYLAILTSAKLAAAGDDVQSGLWSKFNQALVEAEGKEALFITNEGIPADRNTTMRRGINFMGQVLSGSVELHTQVDKLRWAMNREWEHAIKYCLEQGAWNFASKRAILSGGTEPMPGGEIEDIIEGYAVAPATEPADSDDLPDMAGYTYGFLLPSDYLHKIWIKADANRADEIDHQILGQAIYTNVEPVVLEYIAYDDDTIDPTKWPATFLEVVGAYLASIVAPELRIEAGRNGSKVNATNFKTALEANYRQKLTDAKTKDAIQQFPHKIPSGSFVRARSGSRFTMYRTS